MKILKTFATLLVLIFLISIISETATAGAPPAVPTPKPAPSSGGGGSSSPSYSAPVFESYTVDLKSGSGTTVGSMTGIDYFTVRLNAASSGTVNGKDYSVVVTTDLNSMPANPTLDITLSSDGNIPGGSGGLVTLTAAKITASSTTGWSLKSGTSRITFSVPSAQVTDSPDAKLFVVYYDGANYHFITPVATPDGDVTKIEAQVPGFAGTYTVVESGAVKQAPSPTASPSTAPSPAPTPSPSPAPTGLAGLWSSLWLSTFGTFAIGETAGAVVLVLLGRFSK